MRKTFHPSVGVPIPGVVHLMYGNQEGVAKSFMRLQEFYESPMEEFRGKRFTKKEFIEAYEQRFGTKYWEDWNGFNVPGHVVDEFRELYPPEELDFHDEHFLFSAIRLNTVQGQPYYVIGTHAEGEATLLDH